MSYFTKSQTEKIISLALEAAEIAATAFKARDFMIAKKSDHSSVTSADLAVSKFLIEKLTQEFPQIPIICEEGKLREVEGNVFFLIDPIDGTSSFVKGEVEFALNIALIKNDKAIFGLIYSPLFENGKMIFSNHKDQIICRTSDGKEKILKPIKSDLSILRVITSARTKDADITSYLSQMHPEFINNFAIEKLSSAIKFFRILESEADLYLHFRPSMEWDTAAGQALIELMGGKVKNLFFNQENTSIGENLIYKKLSFLNQPFISFLKHG